MDRRLSFALLLLLAPAACGRGEVFPLMGRLDVGTTPLGDDAGQPAADTSTPILADAEEPGPFDGGFIGFDADQPEGDVPIPPLADAEEPPLADVPQPPRPDAGPPPFDGGPHPTDSGPIRPDGGPIPTDGGPSTPDAGRRCAMDRDCLAPGSTGLRCDTTTGQCVECLNDMQCLGGNRVCDLGTHTCRSRCQNGQCFGNTVCDPSTNTCVECVTRADCDPGEQCDPVARHCVQCLGDMDCALVPGHTRCDPGTHDCVGCSSRVPCPMGQSCFDGTCVATGIHALCQPCNDDDQCGGPADLCIGLISGGGFVDRTCAQDCANAPCPRGFECISVRNNSARQCRPRYAMQSPTCTAERHLGSPCVVDPNDLDPGCGISGLQDARCVAAMSGGNAGVCTIWCERAEQCPMGFNCVGASANNPGNCL